MKWLRELEERLFWWLYKRWRHRATINELVRHREWLILDIHVKGGSV